MYGELSILYGTALGLGVMHTLLGPDHYLPFVAMARSGKWSNAKTLWVTLLCGTGHVLGSIALGFAGILLGLSLGWLEAVESFRGDLAGWLLLGFGLALLAWGLIRAARNRPHVHVHAHEDGTIHRHPHRHAGEHMHVHASARKASLSPWLLFIVFVFGPCEPLIPILMFPAAQGHLGHVAGVSLVFGAATVATMTLMVMATCFGLSRFRWRSAERYAMALSGLVVTLSGAAVVAGL